MPYKTGKMKGELTTPEIRKLIKAHNVLVSIKIPKGAKREDIIALVKKNGYEVNHEKQALVPKVEMQRKKTIGLKKAQEITKPKPLTEEEKKKRQQAKQKREGEKAFLKTVIPKPPPVSKPSKGVKVGKPPPKKVEPKDMKGFKILSDFLNNNLKKRIKIINDYLDGKITEDKREELENDILDILDTDMREKVDGMFLESNFSVKSKYLKSLQDQSLVKELRSILNKKPKQKKEAPKKEEPTKLNEIEKNRCIKAVNNARSVIRLYEKQGGDIKKSDFSSKKDLMETIKDLNDLRPKLKLCPKTEQDIVDKALSLHSKGSAPKTSAKKNEKSPPPLRFSGSKSKIDKIKSKVKKGKISVEEGLKEWKIDIEAYERRRKASEKSLIKKGYKSGGVAELKALEKEGINIIKNAKN